MSRASLLRIARLALPALLAAAVAGLGAASVSRKVETFQPLGFVSARTGGAWQVGADPWPSTGLRAGDQILLVAGSAPESERGLRSRLKGQSGTELLVLREGALVTVGYQRPPLRIDYRYLVLAFAGAVYLAIGLYTLLRLRRLQGVLFFLWSAASAAVYLFTTSGELLRPIERALAAAEELARLALPPLTLHLFLVFPTPVPWKRLGRVIPFLYLPAAVLLVLEADLMAWGGRVVFGGPVIAAQVALDRLGLSLLAIYSLAALVALALRLRRALDIEERRQLRWMVVGLGAGYLPFVAFYVVPLWLRLAFRFETPELLPTLAVLPLALVPLTFAYAILRFKLWDIEAIVRDAVAWTLTLLLAVLGFSLIDLYLTRGLAEQHAKISSFLSFVAGVGIAGLALPARRSIGSVLERLQFGGSFGKRRALAELGRELLHERELDRLCASLLGHLEVGLQLDRANLYLAQRGGLVAIRPGAGELAQLPPEVLDDDAWERELTAISGLGDPDGRTPPLAALYAAGYRYAFPLSVRGNRVGVVVTGYKIDEVPLSSEDVELMRQVLNQAALAIENAHLLDQLHDQLDELVHLKRYSEGIIESSPAGLAVLDPGERVVSANLAFAALVGVERPAVLGSRLADLLPVTLPQPEDGLVEASLPGRDGAERYLQLSVADLGREGSGQRILIVQDTSERVAIERELKEKDRLASLGMLAAGVAHEVNTPITGISSYAQMLLEETPEGDPRRQLLKKMERQTFRAARIVGSLLEFARNRRGDLGPVPLARVLTEASEEALERCRERGVSLVWSPPGEDILVLGSETELAQVFVNLIGNAVDAMRHGGTLTLSLEADERRVFAAVEDTGVGIGPGELGKIFQPFFSTKLSEGGTGLGLSISYEIVRRHRGEMRVASNPGQGSRFIVELPRHAPAGEEVTVEHPHRG